MWAGDELDPPRYGQKLPRGTGKRSKLCCQQDQRDRRTGQTRAHVDPLAGRPGQLKCAGGNRAGSPAGEGTEPSGWAVAVYTLMKVWAKCKNLSKLRGTGRLRA